MLFFSLAGKNIQWQEEQQKWKLKNRAAFYNDKLIAYKCILTAVLF